MRNFRMRMRILTNFPSCPDWRKVRVGSSGGDEDEIPEEWEMEQTALDKLAFKRQTSLSKLNDECAELQKQLEEADVRVLKPTTLEFIAASRSLDDGLWPSPVVRQASGLPRQSQSLQNIAQHQNPSRFNLPINGRIEAQRLKKLQELRTELEEYATVHRIKGGLDSLENPNLSCIQRGSNLSLVDLHQLELTNGKPVSEINNRIQKRREKELERARREVQILGHKIQQKNIQAIEVN